MSLQENRSIPKITTTEGKLPKHELPYEPPCEQEICTKKERKKEGKKEGKKERKKERKKESKQAWNKSGTFTIGHIINI